MLKSLQIKDYALIESINVEFGHGLNIITGETGAGKSILIDAMGLLLGERASVEVIRKGAPKSIVEGIFSLDGNKKVRKILSENDIDADDELIVRREISSKGSNRCFINDTPVTLNLIKEIGDLLVDLHGQHEHQSLLRPETHIEMLDGFGSYMKEKDEYYELFKQLNSAVRELGEIKGKEKTLHERKDLYSFQLKEIEAVMPEEGEDEKLSNTLKVLENSEKLFETTGSVYNLLYDNELSIHDQLTKVKNELASVEQYDEYFSGLIEELTQAIALIDDVTASVRDYNTKLDVDPSEIDAKRLRLSSINMLKKKFGGSVSAVLQHLEMIRGELLLAGNYDLEIARIEGEIDVLRKKCGDKAALISEKRKTVSKKIAGELIKTLSSLGIDNAAFEVRITNTESAADYLYVNGKKLKYGSDGIDEVEFYVSTNAGEDVKPLIKVASGGEISRIMLSIKSILAKSDKLPLLIFDEIDTGVSGRIAQKVGNALKDLAGYHQIIAITHLPQIAGLADHHFVVEKGKQDERVVSSIRKLSTDEQIKEVAKLMSGENITDASLKGARELMGLRN